VEPIMMSATVALGREPAAEYRILAAAAVSRHYPEPIVPSDADGPDVADPLATARGLMLGLLLGGLFWASVASGVYALWF
jgi:hypothetical protein